MDGADNNNGGRAAGALDDAVRVHQAGNLAQAQSMYRGLLEKNPQNAKALHLLGLTYLKQGEPAAGLELVEKALALKPDYAKAHYNLGTALGALDRHEEAAASYRRAVALRPCDSKAHYNLGLSLATLDRHDEARISYENAVALAPDNAKAHYSLGVTLSSLKRHEDAIRCYERAVTLDPGNTKAHNNLGSALAALDRNEEALAPYDKALTLNPTYVKAHHNRGAALKALDRFDEATQQYLKAVAIDPEYDYALGNLLDAQQYCCDWNDREKTAELAAEKIRRGARAIYPFAWLAISESARDQLLCARTYAAHRHPPEPHAVWTGEARCHEKIRIAYLSPDFRDHAMAHLLSGLFEAHDKSRFEMAAVVFGPYHGDSMTARLAAAFDHFVDVTDKSDLEAATLIHEMGIDIAVDLSGFTTHSRTGILAHRPAPIQVNYLGYPGTMGAPYVDYILADPHVIPLEDQGCYDENVVYLPDCYQPNDSSRRIAQHTPCRTEAGLPPSGFVFCCFNNPYKITPQVFDVWMRLLSRVPGSVLWLLEGNETVCLNLRREAEVRRVSGDRLVFAPRTRVDEHLARHRLADLFLDTSPYNAHTTASDALWTGLPVITRAGQSFASRVAASLLHAVGLPELVTTSFPDYEALALELAGDPERLSEIKAKLARNRSTHPLFDTRLICRNVESAYLTMWDRHQRGEPPAGFAVKSSEVSPIPAHGASVS